MRIYGTVKIPGFDATGYKVALRDALHKHFRKAARAFVRAAIRLIPVDTGMARGSFLNIGQFLNVIIPISPKSTGKIYYPRNIPKTADSGAALTTSPQNIIRFEGNKIIFEIQSSVFHLTLNDFFGIHSAAWGSFEAGRIAFHDVLRTFKAPDMKSFITITSITFGRGATGVRSTPVRLRKQETTRNA